jgi:hypothetical protein
MGIIARIKKLLRQNGAAEGDDFVAQAERFLEQPLDGESLFFFRHHPRSTALISKILSGSLRGAEVRTVEVVLQSLALDMTESLVNVTEFEWKSIQRKRDRLAALVAAFTRTYAAAGLLIDLAISKLLSESPSNEEQPDGRFRSP